MVFGVHSVLCATILAAYRHRSVGKTGQFGHLLAHNCYYLQPAKSFSTQRAPTGGWASKKRVHLLLYSNLNTPPAPPTRAASETGRAPPHLQPVWVDVSGGELAPFFAIQQPARIIATYSIKAFLINSLTYTDIRKR